MLDAPAAISWPASPAPAPWAAASRRCWRSAARAPWCSTPSPARRARRRTSIAQALGKLVEKGRLAAADADKTLGRIEIVESLDGLAPCHVVVEAIVEELEAKRKLFSALEKTVKGDCILASNTSSLSVTAMAAACKRPGRVAGYHFFNPVPVMKIVEVVDGVLTEPWATDALTALAKRFGHTPVRCKDTPGFIVNHAGRAFVPEALRVLSEGIADFATIDRILVDAAGFRLGPFGLMDLVGLDVAHAVMKSMYQQYFEEPKYRPSFLAEPRVAAGLLGRKTGRGWYGYGKDGAALPDARSAGAWRKAERSVGRARAEGAARRARRKAGAQADAGRGLLRRAARRRRDHHRARARPRPGAHRRGRSAVRLLQAPHPDEDSRHAKRGCRRPRTPCSPRTACRSR